MHSRVHYQRQSQAHLKSGKYDRKVDRKFRKTQHKNQEKLRKIGNRRELKDPVVPTIPVQESPVRTTGQRGSGESFRRAFNRFQKLEEFRPYAYPSLLSRPILYNYPMRLYGEIVPVSDYGALVITKLTETNRKLKSASDDDFCGILTQELEHRKQLRIKQQMDSDKKQFYENYESFKSRVDILNLFLSSSEHDGDHLIVTYSWLSKLEQDLIHINYPPIHRRYVFFADEFQKIIDARKRVLANYHQPLSIEQGETIHGFEMPIVVSHLNFDYANFCRMKKLWNFTDLDRDVNTFREYLQMCGGWFGHLTSFDDDEFRQAVARDLFKLPYPKAVILAAVKKTCLFHSHNVGAVIAICEWVRLKIIQMSVGRYRQVQREWRLLQTRKNAATAISRWWKSVYYSPNYTHYQKIHQKWVVDREKTLQDLGEARTVDIPSMIGK